jgi:hypothetical protein
MTDVVAMISCVAMTVNLEIQLVDAARPRYVEHYGAATMLARYQQTALACLALVAIGPLSASLSPPSRAPTDRQCRLTRGVA